MKVLYETFNVKSKQYYKKTPFSYFTIKLYVHIDFSKAFVYLDKMFGRAGPGVPVTFFEFFFYISTIQVSTLLLL